jgi:hypothetical protein
LLLAIHETLRLAAVRLLHDIAQHKNNNNTYDMAAVTTRKIKKRHGSDGSL